MARKTKARPVILSPEHPPDSFTREELLKAIKKVAADRRRRRRKPSVPHGSKQVR